MQNHYISTLWYLTTLRGHSILSEKACDNSLIKVSTFPAPNSPGPFRKKEGEFSQKFWLDFRKFSVVKGIFPEISEKKIFDAYSDFWKLLNRNLSSFQLPDCLVEWFTFFKILIFQEVFKRNIMYDLWHLQSSSVRFPRRIKLISTRMSFLT